MIKILPFSALTAKVRSLVPSINVIHVFRRPLSAFWRYLIFIGLLLLLIVLIIIFIVMLYVLVLYLYKYYLFSTAYHFVVMTGNPWAEKEPERRNFDSGLDAEDYSFAMGGKNSKYKPTEESNENVNFAFDAMKKGVVNEIIRDAMLKKMFDQANLDKFWETRKDILQDGIRHRREKREEEERTTKLDRVIAEIEPTLRQMTDKTVGAKRRMDAMRSMWAKGHLNFWLPPVSENGNVVSALERFERDFYARQARLQRLWKSIRQINLGMAAQDPKFECSEKEFRLLFNAKILGKKIVVNNEERPDLEYYEHVTAQRTKFEAERPENERINEERRQEYERSRPPLGDVEELLIRAGVPQGWIGLIDKIDDPSFRQFIRAQMEHQREGSLKQFLDMIKDESEVALDFRTNTKVSRHMRTVPEDFYKGDDWRTRHMRFEAWYNARRQDLINQDAGITYNYLTGKYIRYHPEAEDPFSGMKIKKIKKENTKVKGEKDRN
jgi:hypothetical protein